MKELINHKVEPNIIEQAIIKWNVPELRKHLIDLNLLQNSGYNLKEIEQLHINVFAIKIPNPSQMTYFEKAIYSNDIKTIENYYYYMKKNKDIQERYGYTDGDIVKIKTMYIDGNIALATSLDDYYEIACRLNKLQNNKNRMAEGYFNRYLEASDLTYEKEAINNLVMIYRDEEYLPGRRDIFYKLIDKFPRMLEYSQLARSFHIELLYSDYSNNNRYQEICKLGDEYERQLNILSDKHKKGIISKDVKDEEEKKYVLEDKAKYLYAISYAKNNGNAWEYFNKYGLYIQTNVAYMKEFLEASKGYLKIYLGLKEGSEEREDCIKILQAMAAKARGKRAGANYEFLLYLNREFGSEYGVCWDELESLYQNADYEIVPFEHNGYGTYLYALVQEYKRIHNNIDEFPYKTEYLKLKKEYYSYYSRCIENYVLKSPINSDASKIKILCINNCVANGERKFLQDKGYRPLQSIPRYMCFFPEQDPELYAKYEDIIQRALESAKESNKKTRNMLKSLRISIIPEAKEEFDENTEELLSEISFYVWKKIQLDYDNSKDQWLILAKIYEAYMNRYKELARYERVAEKRAEYNEIRRQWADKIAVALQIRAELYFVYYDWYDLYQFYLGQVKYRTITIKESLYWVELAYELYLEMLYKIQDDSDRVGRHVEGLHKFYMWKDRNGLFKLCIKNNKTLASRYIESLAKLYYQYSQYRFLQFAFEIAKETGEYKVYLKNFLKALVQWEMAQLLKNIHYLLFIKNYDMAREFYDYSVEHINNTPLVLSLTKELIEGLKAGEKQRYVNVLKMLGHIYPNVRNHYYREIQPDEGLMLENIKALEFILQYYTSSKELVGEIDCSSINNALHKQFISLYSSTMNEDYLEKMLEALILAGRERNHLPYLYRAITICYRYDRLNSYTDSIIRNESSTTASYKLKECQKQIERLKDTFGEEGREVFNELCDLRIYSEDIEDNKKFIRHYILSGKYRVTDELRDYLLSINLISTAWLRLYFEENDKIEEDSSFAEYAMAFDSVRQVIEILESSRGSRNLLINIDNFKACVYNPVGKEKKKLGHNYKAPVDNSVVDRITKAEDPYIKLLKDYMKDHSNYPKKDLELLHHFFTLMSEDTPYNRGISLYKVIDSINEESNYKNEQCVSLLEGLYKRTREPSYLTALARQHAKAYEYKKAEDYYAQILELAEDNEVLAERYAYIKPIRQAVYLLDLAMNGKKVRLEDSVSIKQYCEVLAYISEKYDRDLKRVMQGMEEDDRNLLGYISQLIFEESKKEVERNYELLLKKLLLLRDTRYFDHLLPNLYQWSKSEVFKFSLEHHEDKKIQNILKDRKNKPILVLSKQSKSLGQKLIYIDYARQAYNVNVNFSDESQDSPLLQEAINEFHSKDRPKEISELFRQLEREKGIHSRKKILLHILSYQFENPEDKEADNKLQRKLQLAKAELGYLLHIDEFERNDYEKSIRLLHEGVRFLGNNKADCLYLLERMRERYFVLLDIIHQIHFDRALKLFPIIASDMQRLLQILNNPNNSENVILRDMVSAIYRLQTFGNPLNQDSDVQILETVIDLINNIKDKDNKIDRNRWLSWIYRELIQIVSRDTIVDYRYFIDRKENTKVSLERFYKRVKGDTDHINLYGPKGMGVSSLLKQCYQQYIKEALAGGDLFLYLDGREINNSYNKRDFYRWVYEQIKVGIQRISEFNPKWDERLLEIMEQYEEPLHCIDAISEDEDIERIHLFIDHYEEFQRDKKEETDLLLKRLEIKGAHLVVGSETAIKVELVDFSAVELSGFTNNETKDYIESRIKYKDEIIGTVIPETLFKLTEGIPALLSCSVEYILQSNSFSEDDIKQHLKYKARPLFNHWEALGMNADYLESIMKKNDKSEHDLSNIKDELKDMIKDVLKDELIEVLKDEIETTVHAKLDLSSTGEKEVNLSEYSMSEDYWEEIYKLEKVYKYIKYGEASREKDSRIEDKSDYDFKGSLSYYFTALEETNNILLVDIFKEKMPDYDLSRASGFKGERSLKLQGKRFRDIDKDTTFTLGSYGFFLYDLNDQYKIRNSLGFNFYQFISNYKTATEIRNKSMHAGGRVTEEDFHNALYLLFGYKEYKEKDKRDGAEQSSKSTDNSPNNSKRTQINTEVPPIFECILRLVKIGLG